MANLEKWWASLTPEQRRQIDRRAPNLKPNADLYGKSKPKPKPVRRP